MSARDVMAKAVIEAGKNMGALAHLRPASFEENIANFQISALTSAGYTIASPGDRVVRAGDASVDDIRSLGWTVAVHNDYRLNSEPHTFWLFTKGDRAIKGEGKTDAEALNVVRAAIRAMEAEKKG